MSSASCDPQKSLLTQATQQKSLLHSLNQSLQQQNCPLANDMSYWENSQQQSVIYPISPIHMSFQSKRPQNHFDSHLYNKKVPFGTKASRVLSSQNGFGCKSSQIVAYSRINYQKDQKYDDTAYEQCKNHNNTKKPFISSTFRFTNKNLRSPGPGYYNVSSSKTLSNEQLKGKDNMMHSLKRGNLSSKLFNKWKSQEIIKQTSPEKYSIENDNTDIYHLSNMRVNKQLPAPNKYNLQKYPDQKIKSRERSLREKIKEKADQKKAKLAELKQIMRTTTNNKQNFQPVLMKKRQTQQKFRQDKSHKQTYYNSSNSCSNKMSATNYDAHKQYYSQANPPSNNKSAVKLDLKKLTSSFLPHMKINFQKLQYSSGEKPFSKNKVNYHPCFISRDPQTEKLFGSYIPNDNKVPGPGYYEKKNKKVPNNIIETSSVVSFLS